jgi:DeoR family glycerol-3-phosphate regulon repressor
VGSLTIDTIRQVKFDLAVIGGSALDEGGDILDFDIQKVGTSQTIIRHSRHVILAAEHTKLPSQRTRRTAHQNTWSAGSGGNGAATAVGAASRQRFMV